MPRLLAPTLNALVAAFALVVISSALAQTKPPSMVGQKREQIVNQLGEPKSSIKAGSREVMFFDRVKITMRNGVAIDSEPVADEVVPVKRAPEPAATAPSAVPSTAAVPAQLPLPAPTNSSVASNVGPASTAEAAAVSRPAPAATEVTPTPVKPPEPQLAIKFIKSGPSGKSGPRAAVPAASVTPSALAVAAVETKSPLPAKAIAPESKSAPIALAEGKSSAVATPVAATDDEKDASKVEAPDVEESPAKAAVDPKKKAAVRQRWRLRRDAETEDDSVQIFSAQSYVIAAIVIAAGVGFLWWQRSQRDLAMAATAVSHAPFEAGSAAAADSAGTFSADLVLKLGQRKFERLVASYYAKTGVVAERTNAAPESPVHIKIFWKGEPKPFAGVQCHANPPTLIGPLPLMKLFEALSTADIRRGYVVTTGKFNVEARDLAEEKHFTLLSGDIFLEKLNALPPAARGELLKETNAEEPSSPAGGTAVG